VDRARFCTVSAVLFRDFESGSRIRFCIFALNAGPVSSELKARGTAVETKMVPDQVATSKRAMSLLRDRGKWHQRLAVSA
jgi:hypothetical protein